MQECYTELDKINKAQVVAEQRFAWPGGYALGIVTKDGGCLCSACVKENLELMQDENDEQWYPDSAYYSDPDDDIEPILCDHCNRPISDATDIVSPQEIFLTNKKL